MPQAALDETRPLAVLLIDDEPDICTAWSMVLEMEGMTVLTAQSGREGIALAKGQRPDVVLCDFMMPGMNGVEVCRVFRSDETLRHVSLIVWSAARGINTEGLADLVVEKPVRIEALIDHIRSVPRLRH